MPSSHQRHKPKHHHQQHPPTGKKRRMTATRFMSVMCGIFGLTFAYFMSDRNIIWSVAGTIGGIIIGYYFGHYIDKSVQKNK
jgi:heme/copper-type cytochrome/quinol oxidase subunit 3